LGLRLLKQTVNFDDPGTYHLYYADGFAHPGSFLTFFPYEHANPGRIGEGQAVATAYAVPEGAVDWWMDRFAAEGCDFGNPEERFGRRVLPFRDSDGLALELVETPAATEDRKSTRLNSSHVKNSYAVFCLKKKNKDTQMNDCSRTYGQHTSATKRLRKCNNVFR